VHAGRLHADPPGRWVLKEVDGYSDDARKERDERLAKEAAESASNIKSRYKEKMWKELAEAAVKQGYTREHTLEQCRKLDSVLLDFTPALEKMTMSDHVRLVIERDQVGRRIMILKTNFPSVDIPRLWINRPRTFLQDEEELLEAASQLKQLLSKASDVDNIVSILPAMLNMEHAVSILVTLQRWLPDEDAVQVLNKDPGIILRAQANGMPLDPVFYDGKSWSGQSFDRSSSNLNLEWQTNLRKKQAKEKQEYLQRKSGGVVNYPKEDNSFGSF